MIRPGAAALVLLSLLVLPGSGTGDVNVTEDAVSAARLRIRDVSWRHHVASFFALPHERVTLESTGSELGATPQLSASAGRVSAATAHRWVWQAPAEPGLYRLDLVDERGRARVRVNAFVMVPAGDVVRGRLRGYLIGAYPPASVKGAVSYEPPKGFVEVTAENEDVLISPHFRLKDFLCKQPGGYPKYVVLREALVVKLEAVLARLRARGHDLATLSIMSGYRTPAYNKSIGNVAYSMHLFGGAADVVIVADLDGDRRITRDDAAALSEWIESMEEGAGGGLGVYGATRAHGPFIHVDVRPAVARWQG
jgi:hypothetical protein